MRAVAESQDDIHSLCSSLTEVSDQLQQVNLWISHYDRQLGNMQKYVSEIETENAALKVETSNRVHLAQEAIEIIVRTLRVLLN